MGPECSCVARRGREATPPRDGSSSPADFARDRAGKNSRSGLTSARLPCGHAHAPRCHCRPLARRSGARNNPDHRLGRDLLSTRADRAADRGRARLVDDICHGRVLARVAHCRARLPARRTADRPPWRASRDADRLAARRARAVSAGPCRPPRRLSRSLDAARSCHRCLALRSRLCHAGSHLRAVRATADHGADARRWFRLDGQLARNPSAARGSRLARHLPRLCRAARFRRRAAARVCPAAHACRSCGVVRSTGANSRASCSRRKAGRSSW